MDAGKMPNLEGLVNEGVMGNLATLFPDLSPMLWTSIATGKRPFKHGILGFTEPDPHGRGIRPVLSLSRKTKAFWNVLSQSGMRCNVVGWWPSHPAEPINGVMVSNHYKGNYRSLGEPWPLPSGAVHPARLEKNLEELRWHPQLLSEGHILPFVPRAADVDQDKDRRLETIARVICDCSTTQNAAMALMIHEPWDLTAVYFDAIDHFSHAFMRFHPPAPDWVPRRDAEIYGQVVESGYIYHDMMLGRLLRQAGDDTTVILVSDHGFHSDHLRPRHIPREPAGPAAQHRTHGIFVMKGPGIKADERIYGACLLDVCPTVLCLLGLPVGKDMDGRPLVDAFENPPEVKTIDSWDLLEGDCGMHPKERLSDPIEATEAIEQLVALGYIERPDADTDKAVKQTVRELKYNEARAYMDAGLYGPAVILLKELSETWPDDYRFGIQLTTCLKTVGRVKDARAALDGVFKRKLERAKTARKEIAGIRKKIKERGEKKPNSEEIKRLTVLRSQASVDDYAMQYLKAAIAMAEGDLHSALKHCKQAELADDGQPGLYLLMGEVYLKMRLWDDAEASFSVALKLDPEGATGHLGLCRALMAKRRSQEALEAVFESLALDYHNPMAHYLLGTILHRSGRLPESILALKVAVRQNPNFVEALRRLAHIYKRRLRDGGKAEEYLALAREASKRSKSLRKTIAVPADPENNVNATTSQLLRGGSDSAVSPVHLNTVLPDQSRVITIVSGLPRSGTSMMMQMLDAGGFEILSDGKRVPDHDNPRGYYEYEPAKRIIRDISWLHEAEGKAVKIVAPLLRYLPSGRSYRIIFMERDLSEIAASQEAMLGRKDGGKSLARGKRLSGILARQVRDAKAWIEGRGIVVLFLEYGRCVLEPEAAAEEVSLFLGTDLQVSAAAKAVAPSLYRKRSSI
ncbi:MAG: hypothetical protein COX16_08960 [Deltaproteobacteria bacterium CG23_combo_of_CG06-09_8_20_14_all_51_20]|nr:MAG: hypothetical protein COX16_08960 [Deltaproteobacteria bacterium CG23_combo_of_CG06-09_8_20_14_all_51_20]